MRTLLKFTLDVQAANHAISNGSLPKILGNIMELVKPEAAYFTTVEDTRTVFVFFDMPDSSWIPRIAEPLFQDLNAKVNFYPVMNQQELEQGLGAYMQTQKG
ncbi:MAG: hypothetical protein SFU99_14215 [Saprospiraceae bacterium]|nr:hypothetical protein [Saprospiraceae bacterium]